MRLATLVALPVLCAAAGLAALPLLRPAIAEDPPKPSGFFAFEGTVASRFQPLTPEDFPGAGRDAATVEVGIEGSFISLQVAIDDGEEIVNYELSGTCGQGRFWASGEVLGGLVFVTGQIRGTSPRLVLKASGHLADGAGIDTLKVTLKEVQDL
jgi:hypothetical protein